MNAGVFSYQLCKLQFNSYAPPQQKMFSWCSSGTNDMEITIAIWLHLQHAPQDRTHAWSCGSGQEPVTRQLGIQKESLLC